MKKVVITGIGVITPIGVGKNLFLKGLQEGIDGSQYITRFPLDEKLPDHACEIKNLMIHSRYDPFIQYGETAVGEALSDAGLKAEDINNERTGIIMSSSKGGMISLDKGNFQNFPPDRLNFHLAKKHQIKGLMKCTVAACATGTQSIVEAVKAIQRDEAEIMIAGASDASIHPLLIGGYQKLGVYAKEKTRPFAKGRDGFLAGEGAAALILESEEKALQRKAHIYAEVINWAEGNNPYRLTSFDPDKEGLARIVKDLLKTTLIKNTDIDYLNLHGTGTQEGDAYESKQMKLTFGDDLEAIHCSSTKSMTGHMLGASGAVEAVVCLLAMENGFIPPNINCEKVDEDCRLNLVLNQSLKKEINITLSHSMGFGGHIAALLFRKYKAKDIPVDKPPFKAEQNLRSK